MCGIVGMLIREPKLRPKLGRLVRPMFECMGARGPDSGGFAVFASPEDRGEKQASSARRFNIYAPSREYDWSALAGQFKAQTGAAVDVSAIENHGVLVSTLEPLKLRTWLVKFDPSLHLLSVGRSIDVFKDVGHPTELAQRYRFDDIAGSHAIGHTRMATESDVTPAHCHPFTAGEDFCLVHNGSLSNPYSIRRRLEKFGIHFETDNDTEAACRFLEWKMRDGLSLEAAIHESFAELDGFYTLLMATADRLVLVRDAFACKPAVVAEHPDYVAISSEFRSLAHLPGIEDAKLFEPHPEEIYAWQV